MKSKTKTYILLVAVLTIWGVIGFKILSTLNPDAPKISKSDNAVLFSPKKNTSKEFFFIQPFERDPFLGTLIVKKEINNNAKIIKPREGKLIWPSIFYQGAVSKQDSKDIICVISINGNQHVMKVGQEMDGFKLLKANKDKITVGYKGAKKEITKL